MNKLAGDLDNIFSQIGALWEKLRNQNIFVTGGTGFFGCWLVESFLWANAKYQLNAKMFLLTRNKQKFCESHPALAASPSLYFYEGEISAFPFPEALEFSTIIHAATDTSAYLNETNALLTWNTVVEGTRHMLDFALHCKAKHFLFISSGAVYGKQPALLTHLPETYACRPNLEEIKSTYAVGKCAAEHLCILYAAQYNLEVKIARCFSFVGPYLSLSSDFAIAHFLAQGLKGDAIVIQGDGTAYRSYLYAADLMVWLWTILFCGKIARPYNVGSDEAITIADLARLVANCFNPPLPIKIMTKASEANLPERYLPEITRAREELGLGIQTGLTEAIQTTIHWHENRP